MSALRRAETCGAYIAWHPWLAQIAVSMGKPLIVKIGHSSRLGGRLKDSAYTTCWGEGWRYLMTFEVESKEEAQAVEEGCLHSLKHYRIDGRELVHLPMTDMSYLRKLIAHVSGALEISGTLLDLPVYEAEKIPERALSSTGDWLQPIGDGSDNGLQPIAAPSPYMAAIKKLPVAELPSVDGGDSGDSSPSPGSAPHTGGSEVHTTSSIVASFGSRKEGGSNSPLEDRKYQQDAAAACLGELARLKKTTLIMACRCGKTRVAHMIMERFLTANGIVLFLVPWLALVRQTVDKLCSYGISEDDVIMVGSGTKMTATTEEGASQTEEGVLESSTLPVPNEAAHLRQMTTSPAEVWARIQQARQNNRPLLVVSTYFSAHVAFQGAAGPNGPPGPDGRPTAPLNPTHFNLTIYDECHHVCGEVGSVKAGSKVQTIRQSAFSLAGVSEAQTGPRLFMTATPEYRKGTINMSNKAIFGGVAYRYHLRQGIKAGYVNDFAIQLVASSKDAVNRLDLLTATTPSQEAHLAQALWKRFLSLMSSLFGGSVDPETTTKTPLEVASPQGGVLMMAAQVVLAYTHLVSVPNRKKLLVFCRTIDEAESLMKGVGYLLKNGHEKALPKGEARSASVLTASSRTPKDQLLKTLEEFYDPDKYGILFNCRLFQEGIEFPPLNGVFFATPRHSSRDIVQSMCRALTKVPNKPQSVIYIPVPPQGGDGASPESASPLGRFETLLPFAEAIYSEDPRFYEHLLDPSKPYPLGWLGAYGSAQSLLQSARRAIRYGTKAPGKSGRLVDRLMKNEVLPWEEAYRELARIVHVCRRYPKGNDGFSFSMAKEIGADGKMGKTKVLNFGAWYEWVKKEYVKFTEGSSSALQPHQVRDLEALPEWKTRGIGGPYPPEECMAALEKILTDNGGKMPPVNINNGGWIGLDATPLERLSGFLTTVSQGDGKSRSSTSKNRGFNVSAEKAKLLDQVFGKWGLQWRKDRWYPQEELEEVVKSGHATTATEAANYLMAQGKPGFLYTHTTDSGKAGDYCGRRTVIQIAHEQFMNMAKTNVDDPYIQQHWPGYPEKHKHMEHKDVWEKGLAPPRHAKGELIARAAK